MHISFLNAIYFILLFISYILSIFLICIIKFKKTSENNDIRQNHFMEAKIPFC